MRRAGLAAPALTSPAHPLNPARMDGRRLLRHRTGTLALDGRTLVMGVVNVTPDSFSDGGVHFRAEDAVAGALRLAAEGADILDIGGESTRPGYSGISPEEEWGRVRPVLEGLARSEKALPPLSIDTTKSEVARRALAAGAAIVNDIWGFQRDPELAAVVAEARRRRGADAQPRTPRRRDRHRRRHAALLRTLARRRARRRRAG